MNNLQDISVNYMGLQLNSPVIASSSDFTSNIENIKLVAQAGAGAVVLKSIFEEQILMEIDSFRTNNMFNSYEYTENYIAYYTKKHAADSYLNLIRQARQEVNVPIIASVHCSTEGEWVSYAQNIEKAGANALELNIFILPSNPSQTADEIRNRYISIVRNVKMNTKLPVAVKLHHYFTDLAGFMVELSHEADSLVLFNRFFNPDINLETMKIESADIFSTQSDLYLVLRWMGLLVGRVKSSLSASGGVHHADGVIKSILAGADVVQIASALYSGGPEIISEMNTGLKNWMLNNNFSSLKEIKGLLSYSKIQNPSLYERAQFMKYFSDYSKTNG